MSLFGNLFGGQLGTAAGSSVTIDSNAAPITQKFTKVAIKLIDKTILTPNATWERVYNDSNVDNEEWNVEFSTPDKIDIKILLLPTNRDDEEFLRYLTGTTIKLGTIQGIMYNQGFEPTLKDTLLWQNKRFSVINVDPIQPVDLPIIYIIQFSK